jgi:hypothetical protein
VSGEYARKSANRQPEPQLLESWAVKVTEMERVLHDQGLTTLEP